MLSEFLERCAFVANAPHSRITGLKRKMPQRGIFPNCSLRSQLRLSRMLSVINLEFVTPDHPPLNCRAKLFKSIIIFIKCGHRIKKSVNQNRQEENPRR